MLVSRQLGSHLITPFLECYLENFLRLAGNIFVRMLSEGFLAATHVILYIDSHIRLAVFDLPIFFGCTLRVSPLRDPVETCQVNDLFVLEFTDCLISGRRSQVEEEFNRDRKHLD